ncbi:MAG: hypothetical protein R2778_03090 [Saprospiraceae bacterium]
MVNAENFAISGRLDYQFSGVVLGFQLMEATLPATVTNPILKVQTPIGIADCTL